MSSGVGGGNNDALSRTGDSEILALCALESACRDKIACVVPIWDEFFEVGVCI